MPRTTVRIPLPRSSIGSGSELIFHNYGPVVSSETAYIQASLHADELPGLLVANHLVHLLDKADNDGQVLKKIVVVPFANPIGLSQSFLGSHVGRFSASSGTNFNRDWIDVTDAVAVRVDGHLHPTDPSENVRIIRSAIALEIDNLVLRKEDAAMKKELFKVASMADIVLDLHCDAGTAWFY
jgi:predicted deacylase